MSKRFSETEYRSPIFPTLPEINLPTSICPRSDPDVGPSAEKQPSRLALANGSAGDHEENDEKYGQQEKYSIHQPSPLLEFFTPVLRATTLRMNRDRGFLSDAPSPILLFLSSVQHKLYQVLPKGLSSLTLYTYYF